MSPSKVGNVNVINLIYPVCRKGTIPVRDTKSHTCEECQVTIAWERKGSDVLFDPGVVQRFIRRRRPKLWFDVECPWCNEDLEVTSYENVTCPECSCEFEYVPVEDDCYWGEEPIEFACPYCEEDILVQESHRYECGGCGTKLDLKRDGDEIVYRPKGIKVVLDRMQRLSQHFEDDVIIVVPSYLQMDCFSCGPIAVWSVVKTFHRSRYSLDPVCKACDFDHDGMDQYAIPQPLKKFRIGCSSRDNFTLEKIASILDQGFPIITGSGRDWEQGHWAVSYGYGRNPNRVFLANCLGENQGESREMFEWSEFKETRAPKRFGIVCWGK